MSTLFIHVVNMSITATYIALAIIVIRFFLSRLPKIFSYALWSAVLIRLIVPVSFNSAFSFLSFFQPREQANTASLAYVPDNIERMQTPSVELGISSLNNSINNLLPAAAPFASINPLQIYIPLLSSIWLFGMFVLLCYSVYSYLKVIDNVSTATLVYDNIYETDRIDSPFVIGFVKPKIYIPINLSEQQLSYILAHEQTHIRRLDYLVKPLAFLVLIVHWFNPLMWISFALMSKDMEMSCDEHVIRKLGSDRKGDYSHSLLSLAVRRSGLLVGSPLAFGESHIKSRIKNILSYKKPTLWVVALSIIVIGSLIWVFTANPQNELTSTTSATKDSSGYDVDALINNKTPYVGNNSKVIALIDAMPLPEGIVRDTVELQTTTAPYGVTIHYVFKNDVTDVEMKRDALYDNATFYHNAIVLFSLIDNVDTITNNITDPTGDNTFTYTRDMAEERMGGDVRDYANSSTELMKLIDRLEVDGVVFVNEGVENDLAIIMSSPRLSSNPGDYIKAHPDEYQRILKTGDEALLYLLDQFEKNSNNNDLRAHIMMALMKDLLGDRNNVTDESLSPQEWYAQLKPLEATKLPDFEADVSDPIEQLVYDTAIQQYSRPDDGFTIVAPSLHGSYEEGDKLKLFVTVYSQSYKLYNKTLSETSGAEVPAAITFTKHADGSYTLVEYLEAMDGSEWSKSIREFSVMPVSNKEIEGLADRILNNYGSDERAELLAENLLKHLKVNSQTDVMLK